MTSPKNHARGDEPTGGHGIAREGEDMEREAPRTRRMTFGDSVDRVVVYLLAGLVGWLCINSLDNRDKLTALLAEKKGDAEMRAALIQEIKGLNATGHQFMADLQALKLEAAKHGWNVAQTPPLQSITVPEKE